MYNTYQRYGALTEQELLTVCNKVRESGGGDKISKLSPGTPNDPNACLIASNLNFHCKVDIYYKFFDENAGKWIIDPDGLEKLWCMVTTDQEAMERIHREMGWKIGYALRLHQVTSNGEESPYNGERSLLLPEKVANSATAFDEHAYDSSLYWMG